MDVQKPIDKRHRHPEDASSPLERWVREAGGPSAVARMLDVDRITVGSWIGRRASPSIKTAAKILEKAAGRLTLNDIVESCRAW
jgi:hypothetical protein